jgi:putative ABC transport system ATP-binding protein
MSGHTPSLSENLDRLGSFLSQERSIILSILTYAVAVGLFSLIIPITVQELVNTFAFSVSPVMVVTLVGIMAGILFLVGIFKVLQFYATDILERRVFLRMTLKLARALPLFKEKIFQSDSVNRFFETVFLQRALSGLFVDLINVLVGGVIGMILLALYHPYFIFFDAALIISVVLIALLGKGGLGRTISMSEAKYEAFHWFQEVADNHLQFKAASSYDLILQKADAYAADYIKARKSRLRVLLRQYIGSISLQVFLHTGLLGTAGWLLSQDQLTLGQLVAAEVIIASLLLNLESVVKRSYVIFYFFTALEELSYLFSLPQDKISNGSDFSIPPSNTAGLDLKCSQLNWARDLESVAEEINLEILPGEKWAVICQTEGSRRRLSLALAGLEPPPVGAIRYNEVDLKNLSVDQLGKQRSIVFTRDLSLFKGSITDNIKMGRQEIKSEDLLWALTLTDLDKELEGLPDGLDTIVQESGKGFTPSQRLRILLARAIATRPSLLILDGAMHEVPDQIRESIFNRLRSSDCPWSLVIVTTDQRVTNYVEKHLLLSDPSLLRSG